MFFLIINLLIKGEFFPTISISLNFHYNVRAKLQPALNVLIVFSLRFPFKLFIDKSSEIKIFLNPILFLINLINFLE